MAPETPKGVSSRLLTMKFMQRAVASASSPESPESVDLTKSRKIDHNSPQRRISAVIDQASIQAALDDQETKRLLALRHHSTADTHWTLRPSLRKPTGLKQISSPLNIVYVGYGDGDLSDDSGEGEDTTSKARTSTYKTKHKEKSATFKRENRNESDSGEDRSNESALSSPMPKKRSAPQRGEGVSRSQSGSRHNPESTKAKEFRNKRRKKEVSLNMVTSISSGGGDQFGSVNGKSQTCYNCHKPGHRAVDCPEERDSGNSSRKP